MDEHDNVGDGWGMAVDMLAMIRSIKGDGLSTEGRNPHGVELLSALQSGSRRSGYSSANLTPARNARYS